MPEENRPVDARLPFGLDNSTTSYAKQAMQALSKHADQETDEAHRVIDLTGDIYPSRIVNMVQTHWVGENEPATAPTDFARDGTTSTPTFLPDFSRLSTPSVSTNPLSKGRHLLPKPRDEATMPTAHIEEQSRHLSSMETTSSTIWTMILTCAITIKFTRPQQQILPMPWI